MQVRNKLVRSSLVTVGGAAVVGSLALVGAGSASAAPVTTATTSSTAVSSSVSPKAAATVKPTTTKFVIPPKETTPAGKCSELARKASTDTADKKLCSYTERAAGVTTTVTFSIVNGKLVRKAEKER